MRKNSKRTASLTVMGAFILAAGIAAASYQTPIPVAASNEIPCSPAVDNPYDPNTVIERCSDEDVIRDKETGEETGSTHGIPGGNIVCSEIDKEQFPGTTLDEQCIQTGPQ
jgi:hypothetical protein